MLDIIVVGGGPGGVAATAHAQRLGLKARLISPELGGKINYRFAVRGQPEVETVDGADLVRCFAARIAPETHLPHGVSAIEEIAGGFRVVSDSGEEYTARALVLATGAKPRRLFVPGEEGLWGRGLSYSAISHAPLFAERDVALIGNDRRAQVAALELARVAHTVFFITPQPETLDSALLDRIQARHNVQLFKGWEPISIDGTDYVTGLSLQNRSGLVRQLRLDGVIIELGLIPNSDLVEHLVERDLHGHVRVNQHAGTSHPAIFAAGDVTDAHGELVPIALGEGIKAGLSALEYVVSVAHE